MFDQMNSLLNKGESDTCGDHATEQPKVHSQTVLRYNFTKQDQLEYREEHEHIMDLSDATYSLDSC